MGLNVPFSCSLPFPFPRRLAYLLATIVTLILVLNLLAPSTLPPALSTYPHHEPDAPLWSSDKWIPPALNPDRPNRPAEWDDDGRCLFLSPYDALSPAEKKAAESMMLVDVLPGVVRVDNATGDSGKPFNPIIALLRDGEKKWNNLMDSQSKTFEQAVKKYESKWGRPPPKGFDDWYVAVLFLPPTPSVTSDLHQQSLCLDSR
jgi:beta-1,2-xylosyltransferase